MGQSSSSLDKLDKSENSENSYQRNYRMSYENINGERKGTIYRFEKKGKEQVESTILMTPKQLDEYEKEIENSWPSEKSSRFPFSLSESIPIPSTNPEKTKSE